MKILSKEEAAVLCELFKINPQFFFDQGKLYERGEGFFVKAHLSACCKLFEIANAKDEEE